MSTDDVGKMFVGGLSWETTKDVLQDYFSQYGEVTDCVVMKNNETGRSRGFGFVTFKDADCVTMVMQTKPHELNGRIVDAKECTPRAMQKTKKVSSQGKIFLGGLPPDVTENDVRGALSCFGRVSQVSIMLDPESKKCRGFGFISFESEDSIEQACAARFVNLNGKQVECKRAEARERRAPGQQDSGGMRQSSYGNAQGYQGNWNQPPQSYPSQSQGYSNYNSTAGSSYQGGYGDGSQYQQPSYSYGTSNYGYSQPSAAAPYSQPAAPYSQTPAPYSQTTAPYSQAASAPYSQMSAAPYSQAGGDGYNSGGASNMENGSYGYNQNQSSYGPSKAYGSSYSKGSVENGQTAAAGQGYHPYRR